MNPPVETGAVTVVEEGTLDVSSDKDEVVVEGIAVLVCAGITADVAVGGAPKMKGEEAASAALAEASAPKTNFCSVPV